MSEFSDRPLVAGTLTGIRSFRVDGRGRLTGVYRQEVFTPGENVARCFVNSDSFLMYQAAVRQMVSGKQQQPARPHRLAHVDCSCGYYAYWDNGHNPYHGSQQMLALIEGYGNVTVGSRGFRSEKAKLVAFVCNYHKQSRLDQLAEPRYNDLSGPVTGALGVVAFGFAVSSYVAQMWWLGALLSVLSPLLCFWCYLSFRAIDVHYDASRRKYPMREFKDVLRNYPDVPIYFSLQAALRDHPLTPPPPAEVPTPDSDPEFWTRDAL